MNNIVYLLCGVIATQQILHYFERKDLYDRIMSRNLTEYKDKGETRSYSVSAHRRVLGRWKQRGGGDE